MSSTIFEQELGAVGLQLAKSCCQRYCTTSNAPGHREVANKATSERMERHLRALPTRDLACPFH